MTREEVIDIVKSLAWHKLRPSEEDIEQAIKALEQEPCEKTQMVDKSNFSQEQYRTDLQSAFDCGKASVECEDAISRQALVEWIQDKTFGDIVVASEHNFDCLPPVTPKPKMGHWRHYEGMLYCSKCGAEFYDEIMEYTGDEVPKHCPDCGAKMTESEES